MEKFLKLLAILMLSTLSWSCSSEEEFDEFDHPQYPINHIWGFEIPLPSTGYEYVIRIPASGWIRYDSIAGSKVFLADQIFNIPIAKLNDLARRPMLVPDSLTFMPVDTYKNTVYVEYADSVTINGGQYQNVNFLPASKANNSCLIRISAAKSQNSHKISKFLEPPRANQRYGADFDGSNSSF